VSSAASITENLVIGGGLAGAMVAMRLAAAGRSVLLLEKEHASHHKVCGEFLSREAVHYLRQAGLDPLRLGASSIRSVRLSSKRSAVEAALPFTALSLSRRILDEALIASAAGHGCAVQRGVAVERLEARSGTWNAQLSDGRSLRACSVFLATGKHDLRGFGRGTGVQGDLVGFKLHWRLDPAQTEALREYMELFLFSGGYGGLSLVEGDVANLCLVVRRSTLRKLGGWADLLQSLRDENLQMRTRLAGARALWPRPLAISSIPYGYLGSHPGLWCVGDQAAVVPSFTGDGMSIALHSGALAAEMHLAGQSAEQFQLKLQTHLRRGMTLATMLSRAMVTSTARQLAPLAMTLLPLAIGWIARATRVPERALVSFSAG
jgi:flavin-dependent dehydrogenase